ncbi:6-phosphofructokinase [Wallemia mellicola]|uniref:ATP-dependent 6-phosphofructokinase n=1 Tax=Wallemia mellicola TaxID=1708541 RepID=A0A4T0NJF1_9BASI|nr:6-phosphofructokinase [Wallemia mellicola]TIB97101.1 6-phosphofructokinase [Wallemia mellicola]TIB99886.1 6-phosphofructokinase [Wallemia mellicola]TIC12112.1 6-phosphofructokinase [Wallemia mellicola]TIC16665.1 6-phosphofructokinase [Wallemia mellicola]
MISLHSKNENPKRRICVLSSGGDAPGMNAAVRAVVKMGLYRGCEVYIVREGWAGLVAGNTTNAPTEVRQSRRAGTYKGKRDTEGENFAATYGEGELLQEGAGEGLKGRHILKVGWDDVRGWMDIGGTLIGTARCAEFREREGRATAAYNLVSLGIDALVVIGGDGSLTGADRLRGEWPSLLDDLEKSKRIDSEQRKRHAHLTITGVVGSIDNDMAMTDITIGAPTALHRISEAVDSIGSTASSHSRAFVVEVMGRHCGWLAVMAGLACGADYIFIPERPPTTEDWESEMCNLLKSHRDHGKRKTIVIIAEGALDRQLKPIKPAYVAEILTKRLQLDTRVTTLGHVQRGGKPCAYDRLLATLQGVEAVESVLDSTPSTPSYMIGLKENKVSRTSLMEAVKATASVGDAIEKKDFKTALGLRDPEFQENLEAFDYSTIIEPKKDMSRSQNLRIGIIHVGAPAGGMNAATREAARFCLARGHTPLAIYNGFEGLWAEGGNSVQPLSWLQVDNWSSRGGSELGTNRSLPADDFEKTSEALQTHNIDALLLIGGYEAYTAISSLKKARTHYAAFQIAMAVIPATLSNNVPLTEFSVGSDTALNALVDACDAIKQSAAASRNRVFVIETQGGKCGYLATVGALATGANIVYTPEIGMDLELVQKDVEFLKRRFALDIKGKSDGRFIIRNEKSSQVYTTEFLTNMLKEEGKDLFDSRAANLGHTLQGGTPSPIDRARACRLAIRCIKFLEEHSTSRQAGAKDDSAAVIVIENGQVRLAPIADVAKNADDKNRRGLHPWWLDLRHLVEILSVFTFLSVFPRAPPSIPFAFEEPQPEKPDCLSCSLDPNVALVDSHSVSKPLADPTLNKQLSESQCLKEYDGLFYEAERAFDWWSERGGITKEHLEKASDKAHGRVVIHNNRMYVKEYRHGDVNTRAMATFAAIHEAVLTSPGAIPNVEFTFQIQDAGDSYDEPIPTFVLDRTADQPELWLMPDFGFWSWPEPKVGSYVEVRDKAGK